MRSMRSSHPTFLPRLAAALLGNHPPPTSLPHVPPCLAVLSHHSRSFCAPATPPGDPPASGDPHLAPVEESSQLASKFPLERIERSVAIIGGGVAGLTAAATLRTLNIPVHVLEAAENVDLGGCYLPVLSNGWNVLEKLEIAEELRTCPQLRHLHVFDAAGKQLLTRDLHDMKGFAPSQEKAPRAQVAWALDTSIAPEFRVVRSETLAQRLLERIGPENVTTGARVTAVGTWYRWIVPWMRLEEFPKDPITARVVLCADGPRTVGKPSLIPAAFQDHAVIRGHSVVPQGKLPVAEDAITYYIGEKVRLQIFPTSPTSAYWQLLHPAPRTILTTPATSTQLREDAIYESAPLPQAIIDLIAADDPTTRVSREGVFRTFGSNRGNKSVTLAGQALLPLVPDTFWGETLALEDALVLGRCLRENWSSDIVGRHLRHGMRTYETERHRRVRPVGFSAYWVHWLAGWPAFRLSWLPGRIVAGLLSHVSYYPGSI